MSGHELENSNLTCSDAQPVTPNYYTIDRSWVWNLDELLGSDCVIFQISFVVAVLQHGHGIVKSSN